MRWLRWFTSLGRWGVTEAVESPAYCVVAVDSYTPGMVKGASYTPGAVKGDTCR